MTPEGKVSIGDAFGLLVVRRFVGRTPVYRKHVWIAVCACGEEVVVKSQELLRGDTKSCGCLHRAATIARNRDNAKHRDHGSAEYRSWRGAKDRCFNPNSKDWNNYGGRGIKMCEEWAVSFDKFLADMGRRPTRTHSLDRIDVNGNYCPSNCRWSTVAEQSNNRRTNRLLEHEGVIRTVSQWAKEYGMNECTLRVRLYKQGLSIEEALMRPVRKWRKNGGNP